MTRHVAARARTPGAYCVSCEARLLIGEPDATETWYLRLRAMPLTVEQVELLQQGAAEYAQLCREAGEPESAVGYVDWVRPEALGTSLLRVEFDGAPARGESGGFARHKGYTHHHPDPLPTVSLPPKIRGAA